LTNVVDCPANFVLPDKVDGLSLPRENGEGKAAIWLWTPEKPGA
jgi:hypothetical protein